MPTAPLFSFASVHGLLTALMTAAAIFIIAAWRRPAVSRTLGVCFGVGVSLLVLATGRPVWHRPTAQTVSVMVDLSASTRTARYRDRDWLTGRIRGLLRNVPYDIHYFAAAEATVDPAAMQLPDLPGDRTTYLPPAAAAVLLFSDCQFEPPERSPPTYVVVDSGLERPADSAVSSLEIRGNQIAASIRNNDRTPRTLAVRGGDGVAPTTVPPGATVVTQPLSPTARIIAAELSPGDPWPENDSLAAVPPPPETYERWWVGRTNPGPGWQAFQPQELPTDSAAYLAAGVIVLDNVAASELDDGLQRRLAQYVRDLGGGLVILGGDHAFAAGSYTGTDLDVLSPLASDPPAPTNHWVLVADASGSMSGRAGDSTRWSLVTGAMLGLLPHLPPEDLASVGSFADSLQWWETGKSVHEVITLRLPPADVYPHGPTNLQPALEGVARSVDGKTPVQLLVLSDFETQITGVEQLTALFTSKHVRLHLLAIGEGTALPSLRQLAKATGGSIVTEPDPRLWSSSAMRLARQAGSNLISHDPVRISYKKREFPPTEMATTWNRVWTKPSAELVGDGVDGVSTVPMAAAWNLGEGRVTAVAYEPKSVTAFVDSVARPPRDPRFAVSFNAEAQLTVSVSAVDRGTYLNGRQITLELRDADNSRTAPPVQSVPQTAPGRYELSSAAPRSQSVATVRAGPQVIGRYAVAGRYAPEFDAIGNNRPVMDQLVRRSGGELIPPQRTTAIDIHWPTRRFDLTPILAATGGLLLCAGLVAGGRR